MAETRRIETKLYFDEIQGESRDLIGSNYFEEPISLAESIKQIIKSDSDLRKLFI